MRIIEKYLLADTVSAESHRRLRTLILDAIQQVIGTFPGPATIPEPVNVKYLKTETLAKVIRYKIHYQAYDGDWVPAYLLMPRNQKNDLPCVLALHGTGGDRGRTAGIGGPYPRYCLELAEQGYVAIAPDYITMGEHSGDPIQMGYRSGTIKGILDHMRAVDLMHQLPGTHKSRTGVIGTSLGGHNALFLSAFDPRITAVATNCGFDSFYDYKGGNLTAWCQNCYMPAVCEDYGADPERLPFDFPDVLAAIAPRPIFISAPLYDHNFKVDSVRKCVSMLEPLYQKLNAYDNLWTHYPPNGHDFPPEERKLAYRFLDRYLK